MVKSINIFNILFMLILFNTIASADTTTQQVHPDEPKAYTHNTRFSSESALNSLQLIKKSLNSFKKITEDAAAEKPIILNNYPNTDWETQNIGFDNAIITIEGVIRKQDYMSKKIEYLTAVCNKENGKAIDVSTINKLKRELQQAEARYSDFLKRTKLKD